MSVCTPFYPGHFLANTFFTAIALPESIAMKKHKPLFLIIICMMTAIAAFAADRNPRVPRWTSDKGFWVVETNIHTPLRYTVYFYNRDGVQVYKEKLQHVHFDVNKRRTKMQLKRVLEASVLAWEQQHTSRENEALVISRLKKK